MASIINWEMAIAILIIVGLILAVWAKISGMTIPELLRGLTDYARDTKEDIAEKNLVRYYDDI